MAERIVSPGVFTREKDLSFLPQGISDIGAALIGPTEMGPAFVPTIINSFGEFEEIFGKENQDFYVPFTAKQYLRSAGTVTIVRVLNIGGYKNDVVALGLSGSEGHKLVATLKPSKGASDPDTFSLAGPTSASLVTDGGTTNTDQPTFTLTLNAGSGATKDYSLTFDSSSANYIGKVFSEDAQDTNEPVYLYSLFPEVVNNTSGSTTLKSNVTLSSGSNELT